MQNVQKSFYQKTLTYHIINAINAQIKSKVSLFLYILGILFKVFQAIVSQKVRLKNVLSASVRFGVDSLPL